MPDKKAIFAEEGPCNDLKRQIFKTICGLKKTPFSWSDAPILLRQRKNNIFSIVYCIFDNFNVEDAVII